MMGGRDHWAVAVLRPDASIHLESHDIGSSRRRWLDKPGLRGILALGQALSIGVRALTISANQSVPEEEKLSPKQIGFSMVFAFTLFTAGVVNSPLLGFLVSPPTVFSHLCR